MILKNIWSTAEHNLYLMLKLPRQTNNIVELHSKNLGILGHGRLGSMVKRLARPLFNKVYVMDKKHNKPEFFKNIIASKPNFSPMRIVIFVFFW